jgi:hypothetical protein
MNGLYRRAFLLGLSLNAWLTRRPFFRPLEVLVTTPFFVFLTRLIRGKIAEPLVQTPGSLGKEWERLLGSRRYAHVVRIDEKTKTAYGEITGFCPLRGTGDVMACHRLMAYDRGLMKPLGARFVVLESQSEPGRTSCSIAIRANELDASDLMAAHERVSKAGRVAQCSTPALSK